MKYAIIFDSVTGNTKLLAQTIKDTLQEHKCIFFGESDECCETLDCDLIFLGSWCDKGTISEKMKMIFPYLQNHTIAIFGTCGYGGEETYFEQIGMNMMNAYPDNCLVLKTYLITQGKMPMSVRSRYKAMLENPQLKVQAESMLQNFDKAMIHPDKDDLEAAKQFALKAMEEICK